MEKPVIYYVFDPLCGWCYGFSPVIRAFAQKHALEFEFRVVTGGMVLGEREGPIAAVAPHDRSLYERITALSGQKFGEAYFQDLLGPGTAFCSSLPGALAMAAFRTYQPDRALDFAARIQKAIFGEGLPPAEAQTFGHCAEDFGMNSEDFMKLMVKKRHLEIVQKEFKVVRQWGIQAFPAVVLEEGDKGYLLGRGYQSLAMLEAQLEAWREKRT